jgi:hypothetical protein
MINFHLVHPLPVSLKGDVSRWCHKISLLAWHHLGESSYFHPPFLDNPSGHVGDGWVSSVGVAAVHVRGHGERQAFSVDDTDIDSVSGQGQKRIVPEFKHGT